jgi:hypothetical protein
MAVGPAVMSSRSGFFVAGSAVEGHHESCRVKFSWSRSAASRATSPRIGRSPARSPYTRADWRRSTRGALELAAPQWEVDRTDHRMELSEARRQNAHRPRLIARPLLRADVFETRDAWSCRCGAATAGSGSLGGARCAPASMQRTTICLIRRSGFPKSIVRTGR